MYASKDICIIPKDIRRQVEHVVRQRLGASVVSIRFQDIEFSAGELTVIIEITMRGEDQRGELVEQPSFFGLTRSVRNAMGSVGQAVFPVLRPVSAHA